MTEFKAWPARNYRTSTNKEVLSKFIVAVSQLYKNDIFLFERGVNELGKELERGTNERSISHKLAEYLQQQFPEWNVDCEYNRHGLEIKQLDGPRKVYPDIIVHHRGYKDNLLVVELKTSDDSEENDISKLKWFTMKPGDFEYQLGIFVRLKRAEITDLKQIKNGSIL